MYTPWNATLENTKNLASFYIVTGSDSFEQCGFKDKNATVPSNAQFMGFTKCKYNKYPFGVSRDYQKAARGGGGSGRGASFPQCRPSILPDEANQDDF